jgi:hypothetical protein
MRVYGLRPDRWRNILKNNEKERVPFEKFVPE